MGEQSSGYLERLGLASGVNRWRRKISAGEKLSTSALADLRVDISRSRANLAELSATADRLWLERAIATQPLHAAGSDWCRRLDPWRYAMDVPGGVRPSSPTELSGGTRIFHDAMHPEMSFRQIAHPRGPRQAQFAMRFEFYGFDGSFLSIVHDLPPEALAGLSRAHLIAVDVAVSGDVSTDVFARLTVEHGPNSARMVRHLDFHGEGARQALFDLAETDIDERRISAAWVDVILEAPRMSRIDVDDLVIARTPRADV